MIALAKIDFQNKESGKVLKYYHDKRFSLSALNISFFDNKNLTSNKIIKSLNFR